MFHRMDRTTYWSFLAGLLVLDALMRAADIGGRIVEIGLICLSLLRLHDIGRSGWWITSVVLLGLPVIGLCALTSLANVLIALLGFMLVSLVLLIVLGLIPGQPGANRYGPAP